MLLTVQELRDCVASSLPALVDQLSELTGRGGEAERLAWRRSLPKLAQALSHPSLDRVHVHFARRQHHLALEYQLPGSASYCDVVLLGRHESRPSAVIIELKDWETSRDRPGLAEGLVERHGTQELHPSDQVRGYVEYCRGFHSAVVDRQATIHGFVLFTNAFLKRPYVVGPNERLAANHPIFTMAEEDLSQGLPGYLSARLTECDAEFATAFATGTYRQDRGFMSQIGHAILDGDTRQFELLDNQRRACHLCLATTREVLAHTARERRVVVVEGPPGSGKSAVAARLWASLVTDETVREGNIVVVTTSLSQGSNWTHLIDRAGANRAGRGVARKASSFSPLHNPQLGRLRRTLGINGLYKKAAHWREHLADFEKRGLRPQPGAENDSVYVSLVDEAHALANPEREHGVGQLGFPTGLGPPAYHIMRCSRLTVFFLDPEQSFRAHENTRVDDIENWARELGARVDDVSLRGAQFRCAGSTEYVGWVESLLSGASEAMNCVYASAWYTDAASGSAPRPIARNENVVAFRRRIQSNRESQLASAVGDVELTVGTRAIAEQRGAMDFRIFADPFAMEEELRKLSGKHVVRLVSSFSRPWKTEGFPDPHRLPAEAQDFSEPVVLPSGERRTWARPWNYVPKGDYTGFIAGRKGAPIHEDPLCEVGCTYTVRGFDFDYLGLLWLDDLLWRDGGWVVPLKNVHETGISRMVARARTEGETAPAGPRGANVLEKVRQAYRILLTRAIRGVFVWIADEPTRLHVARCLSAETK